MLKKLLEIKIFLNFCITMAVLQNSFMNVKAEVMLKNKKTSITVWFAAGITNSFVEVDVCYGQGFQIDLQPLNSL